MLLLLLLLALRVHLLLNRNADVRATKERLASILTVCMVRCAWLHVPIYVVGALSVC